MNARAKGSRLEAKSISCLRADGARLIFRGKGIRRNKDLAGLAQVDLICFHPGGWCRLVEVTVPANRARARRRLEKLLRDARLEQRLYAEVHVWRERAKEPEREAVEG